MNVLRMFLIRLIDAVLSVPWIFEAQQRLCNNYEAVREAFKTYLDVSGKDILDIGCSTGTCGATAVPIERNRYVGIDIEPKYIEIAKRMYPRGTFAAMDARRLEFADRRFDVIFFTGSLHHMEDQVIIDCFKEVRRVLKDDGVVLLAEPLFTKGSYLSNFLLRLDRGKHIRDKEGYQRFLSEFRIVEEGYFRLSFHRFCSFVLRKK